jgi:hypothetical protein
VRRGRVGARSARGGEWLGSSHVASFVHAPSSSRPYGSRVNPLVDAEAGVPTGASYRRDQ